MSPSDDSSNYPAEGGASKKAMFSLAGIKFIELGLIIACIALIDEPATHSNIRTFITPRTIALCYVTFGAMLIYTAIYLAMSLFVDLAPWKTSTIWAVTGFFLFLASTAMLFRDWSTVKDLNYWHPNMYRLDLVVSTASVSLIATVVFLIDVLLTLRFGFKGEME